jgi:DNA-binding CsgD family transcriptional regulator
MPRSSVNQKQMHSPVLAYQRSIKALVSLKPTLREAEVLFWISQGKSNHDIGVILGAKTGTICKHVEHILGKLNVENRTAAVVALEICRSDTPASESSHGQSWAAVAGLLRRSSVRYARIVPNFTANSRV